MGRYAFVEDIALADCALDVEGRDHAPPARGDGGSGFAYKDIGAVVDVLDRVGISHRVATLTPIGNIKE